MLANSGASSVDFHDADKLPIDPMTIPTGSEFTKCLRVTVHQTNKLKMVTFGFFMQSNAPFSVIKNTIGFGWLRKHHVFLRIQHLDFNHGTDLYLLGYIIHENPSFANLKEMEHRLALNWFEKDDRDKIHRSNKSDLIQALKDLEKEKAIVLDEEVQIPITVEKGSVKVSAEGMPVFDSQVLYVYVPRKWREAALFLSDRTVFEKELRRTMIPFALSKADPLVFYWQLATHQKFMNTHRNIQIRETPMTHFNSTTEIIGGTSTTLSKLLIDHPKISRVYRFPEINKVNVSVKEDDYIIMTKWIDEILSNFKAFHPKRVYGNNVVRFAGDDGSITSSTGGKSKYSSRFQVSEDNDYDPLSVQNAAPRRNAWASSPPLELYFDNDL